MCGIAGIYNQVTGAPVPEGVLGRMAAVLQHRGPDQMGTYRDGSVGFAHTRLKIIDLAGGQQPMSDPSGQVTLTYNGEVWNYRAVRDELRRRGHSFRSESDTEVVLQAYLAYGEQFVEHLDGMFALAIWDAREQKLVLARDRTGKKPLYYAFTPEGDLVFGSEIKALFCDPRLKPGLDAQALSDFVVLRYVPAPRTMFAGVQKLPQATVMTVDRGAGVRQRTYWDLPLRGTRPVPSDREGLQAVVRQTVRDAVEARLMSDVPLGALLSGGVDSSVIVAEASALLRQPLMTFSVRFSDAPPKFDETPYARFVAEKFHTDHHEISVGEQDLLDALPLVGWHRDEPISEPAEVPTYLICREAKPYATVLLSGEGGDELFAGYPKYAYDWLAGYLAPLPGPLRGAARAGVDLVPPRFRRAKVAARSILEADEARRWSSWFGAFTDVEKARLLAGEFARQAPVSRIFHEWLGGQSGGDALARMLYLDTAVWLPDNLLMKGDKMSMAASIETRMPFLDRRLLELAASIPSNRRVRPFVSKYLLKESYVGVLPRDFLYRQKVGFQVPIGTWLRSPRFEFLRQMLVGERARARGLFQPAAVETLLGEHLSGRANHQSKLFVLLAIELWHRLYLDAAFDSAPGWDDVLDPAERAVPPGSPVLAA